MMYSAVRGVRVGVTNIRYSSVIPSYRLIYHYIHYKITEYISGFQTYQKGTIGIFIKNNLNATTESG